MIEKILDNYYSKKLDDFIKFIEREYFLDFKHIYTKYEILIQVKKKKYKNELYKEIIHVRKANSLYFLCNKDDLKKYIKRLIKDYTEKEVDSDE